MAKYSTYLFMDAAFWPPKRCHLWLHKNNNQAAKILKIRSLKTWFHKPVGDVTVAASLFTVCGLSVCYLDAELVVCGGVVKFSARDDGEDVTVLQVWQYLQVPGLLWGLWGWRYMI